LTYKQLSVNVQNVQELILREEASLAAKGSAEKSQRKSEARRLRNRMVKSRIRSEIRKFLELIEEKNKEKAVEVYRVCQKLLDTAARKNIIHRRTAARKKSRLIEKLKSLEA